MKSVCWIDFFKQECKTDIHMPLRLAQVQPIEDEPRWNCQPVSALYLWVQIGVSGPCVTAAYLGEVETFSPLFLMGQGFLVIGFTPLRVGRVILTLTPFYDKIPTICDITPHFNVTVWLCPVKLAEGAIFRYKPGLVYWHFNKLNEQ